jgi:hypothetical protein
MLFSGARRYTATPYLYEVNEVGIAIVHYIFSIEARSV